jgi:hypothetical protein
MWDAYFINLVRPLGFNACHPIFCHAEMETTLLLIDPEDRLLQGLAGPKSDGRGRHQRLFRLIRLRFFSTRSFFFCRLLHDAIRKRSAN